MLLVGLVMLQSRALLPAGDQQSRVQAAAVGPHQHQASPTLQGSMRTLHAWLLLPPLLMLPLLLLLPSRCPFLMVVGWHLLGSSKLGQLQVQVQVQAQQ